MYGVEVFNPHIISVQNNAVITTNIIKNFDSSEILNGFFIIKLD